MSGRKEEEGERRLLALFGEGNTHNNGGALMHRERERREREETSSTKHKK